MTWLPQYLGIMVSAFAGAFFAFLRERIVRQREERERQLTAGNKALFVLVDQVEYLRRVWYQALEGLKDEPTRWIRLPPMTKDPPFLVLDTDELGFLIRGADANLLMDLLAADRCAQRARQLLAERTDFHTDKVQPVIEELEKSEGFLAGGDLPIAAIETALAPRLLVRLQHLTDNVFSDFREAIELNERAFRQLQEHLYSQFPKGRLIDHQIVGGGVRDGDSAAHRTVRGD